MSIQQKLADYEHPLVQETAKRLIAGKATIREQLESLFFYVRDEIQFGFPPAGDLVKASETIRLGYGQCNTKGTLFLALCRAAGIPARIHFSLIKKEIQRGLFSGPLYRLMPDLISHSWLEVEVEGRWRRIDAYINDEAFYQAGKAALQARAWDTGYSVACSSGESSADFNLDEEQFVQMDAVVEDQGVWDDPADYYATDLYKNRPSALKLLIYRLAIGRINRKVDQMRQCCVPGSPVAAGNEGPMFTRREAMKYNATNKRNYIIVGLIGVVVGAVIGGGVVAVAGRLIPKMMAEFPRQMMARMREEGLDPAEMCQRMMAEFQTEQ